MPTPSEVSPIFNFTTTSGVPTIDAMLITAELLTSPSDVRATFVGVTGAKWGAAIGTGATITYSFIGPQSVFSPDYISQYNGGIADIPEAERAAFRSGFDAWSHVANVNFQELIETPSVVGDVRIGISTTNFQPGVTGMESFPPSWFNGAMAGDIWVSSGNINNPNISFSAGGKGYNSALHEIGHAVFNFTDTSYVTGLRGSTLSPDVNYRTWTIMADTNLPGTTAGSDLTAVKGVLSFHPTTPMVLDILAAQWLYGANTSFNAGDNVYLYSQSKTYFETIWDAGGNDTISLQGNTKAGTIDLRPGHYSDVGSVIDFFSATGTVQLHDTVGIAYGAIIENAIGGAGDDRITGNDVANTIRGNAGNDAIDGGAGLDTAAYSGVRSNFTLTRSGAQLVATDTTGVEGTDTLTNVERLAFTGSSVAFDIGSGQNAGEAYRVYQAAFNRVPDKPGLGYWIRELDAGHGDLAWVANNFIISNEFKATYGSPETVTDTQFVTLLYNNVLHRGPDAAGLAFWLDTITHGFSRARTLASFSESAENQANVIGVIQNGIEYN